MDTGGPVDAGGTHVWILGFYDWVGHQWILAVCDCKGTLTGEGCRNSGGLPSCCGGLWILGGCLWMLGGSMNAGGAPWVLGYLWKLLVPWLCRNLGVPGCWKPVAPEGPRLPGDPNLSPPRPPCPPPGEEAGVEPLIHPGQGGSAPGIRYLPHPRRVVPCGERVARPESGDRASAAGPWRGDTS